MTSLFRVVAILGIGSILLAGCGTTQRAIYPDQQQKPGVKQTTRSGYTFLRSEKEGVAVTVSLRAATNDFVKTYVSITNQSKKEISIRPRDIEVVSVEGNARFSAYRPEEAPGAVQQAALASPKGRVGVGTFGTTGQNVKGKEVHGPSRGMYASGEGEKQSYMKRMLKQQALPPDATTGGLVFTPFQSGLGTFRMRVPVGQHAHTFRFVVEAAK